MAQQISGSSLTEHRLRKIFIPSSLSIIAYLLISLTMLTLLNIQALWHIVSGGSESPFSRQDIAPLTDKFLQFQDKLATPTVMLFWMGVGIATYLIVWFLENAAFIAKSEVAQSGYLRGGVKKNRGYWLSILTSNLFLIFIALASISFIATYLRVLLPVFSQIFNNGLYANTATDIALNTVSGVLGNALALYLIMLLQRLLIYSWHLNRPS